MYTLASLMAMNGHNFIDILKIEYVHPLTVSIYTDYSIASSSTNLKP